MIIQMMRLSIEFSRMGHLIAVYSCELLSVRPRENFEHNMANALLTPLHIASLDLNSFSS